MGTGAAVTQLTAAERKEFRRPDVLLEVTMR
jgi:hypothetical protein